MVRANNDREDFGMNKKQRIFILIGGLLQIIGGILMVVGAIVGDAFPKFVWFLIAACYLWGSAAILLNYRHLSKKKQTGEHQSE